MGCVGGPYGGPPTTYPSSTTWAIAQGEQSPTSLGRLGGQYAAPIGDSTRCISDRQSDLEALAEVTGRETQPW